MGLFQKNQSASMVGMVQAAAKLSKKCDPDPLESACLDILGNTRLAGAAQLQALAQSNLCAALIYQGRFDDAWREVEAIPTDGWFAQTPSLPVCHRMQRSQLHLARGELDRTRGEQDEALRLEEGRLDGLEADIRALLARAEPKNLCQQAGAELLLGRYYLARGDRAGARPHLEFAASRGNKLYYKAAAGDLLEG